MAGMPRFTPTFSTPDFKDPSGSYTAAYGAYTKNVQDMTSTGFNMLDRMLADRQQRNRGLWQGYLGLNKKIQGKLAGSNKANLMDLADQFTAMSGQISQGMIDAGLGNTSAQLSMQRGVAADYAKEKTRSNNQFAQLQATMMGNVMLPALAARERGIDALTGIRQSGLQFISSMTPEAPDAGFWAQLAQMSGEKDGGAWGMPGMPGASAPQAPTGGYMPKGLFTPSYSVEGGGGSGFSWSQPQSYGQSPADYAADYNRVASGYSKDYSGNSVASYATSPQDTFMPGSGGGFSRMEATGYY